LARRSGNETSPGLLPKKDYSVAKHAKIASIKGSFFVASPPYSPAFKIELPHHNLDLSNNLGAASP
jgi:hypothetical protein